MGPLETDLLTARLKRRAAASSVLLAAVGLVLVGLLGFYIVRDITRPLREVVRVAWAMAAGDLSVVVPPVARGDKFGQVNKSLGTMVANMQAAIIGGIQGAVATLSEATAHIMRVVGKQSGTTRATTAAVSDMTTTVESFKEMARTAGPAGRK